MTIQGITLTIVFFTKKDNIRLSLLLLTHMFTITRLTPAILTAQFPSFCETLNHLSSIGDLTLEKALDVLDRSDAS